MSDAPAALWSRRNLLYRRADRASVSLDGLPMSLWQAAVTLGLRMITTVAGFSFCPDRAVAPPCTSGEQLLPLLELRGLIALLDDLILGRQAPQARVREKLRAVDA